MELLVNNEKIDVSLESEKTVGDVLKAFEAECAKNNATTVAICVDGKKVEAADFDAVSQKELEQNTKIELTIVSVSEIDNALKMSASDFTGLAKELENVAVLIQSGKDKDVSRLIKKTADYIDNFCHIVTYASLFPEEYGKISIDGKSVSDFFADFSPILQEFEGALQSKDTVLTGDLAEYELAPRIKAIADAIRR